jgi:hypothetical protein
MHVFIYRLKIGISEVRPDSISPDHAGRADYHGECVNRCLYLLIACIPYDACDCVRSRLEVQF